jgi:hypothetical protein
MNRVIDVRRVPIGTIVEPITLEKAKVYLRITDTSQDDLITMMIKAAREAIEKATGLSLIPVTVTAVINNEDGGIELPYPPVTTSPTGVKLVGLDYPKLVDITEEITLTYSAGFAAGTIPNDLLFAIYDQLAFMFENRGDGYDVSSVCEKAWRTCIRYTRQPLFV